MALWGRVRVGRCANVAFPKIISMTVPWKSSLTRMHGHWWTAGGEGRCLHTVTSHSNRPAWWGRETQVITFFKRTWITYCCGFLLCVFKMSKIVLYFIPLLYIQLLLLFFILLSFDLILFDMHTVVLFCMLLYHCVTCTIRLHYFNHIYSRTSFFMLMSWACCMLPCWRSWEQWQ